MTRHPHTHSRLAGFTGPVGLLPKLGRGSGSGLFLDAHLATSYVKAVK